MQEKLPSHTHPKQRLIISIRDFFRSLKERHQSLARHDSIMALG